MNSEMARRGKRRAMYLNASGGGMRGKEVRHAERVVEVAQHVGKRRISFSHNSIQFQCWFASL
jgi:hypothetical protein